MPIVFFFTFYSVPGNDKRTTAEPDTINPEIGFVLTMAEIIGAGNFLPNYFLTNGQDKAYMNVSLSFLHYPKGGGSTIKNCIRNIASKAGKPDPVLVFAKNNVHTKEQILNGELESAELFMGTHAFGLCDYLHPKRCGYFTILRDPYDRMVSHYYFCKDGGESSAPCQHSIEVFALETKSIFFRQLTSAFSTCEQNPRFKRLCASKVHTYEELLQSNSKNLEMTLNYLERKLVDMFAVVGILEEFETTLGLMQEALGLPFYDECINYYFNNKINKTSNRALERISSKRKLMENKEVAHVLEADIRLYKKVKEIFQKQKEMSHKYSQT